MTQTHPVSSVSDRVAHVQRNTSETQIGVRVNLDGTGQASLSTGIGFFDHMLDQIARHGLIDLEIQAKGDLHIDFHHSVEDTGIVIGQAIAKALGNFGGIARFGHAYIPMDETLTRCALDISGRPFLAWSVRFERDKVGEMDTELFEEFFRALVAGLDFSSVVKHVSPDAFVESKVTRDFEVPAGIVLATVDPASGARASDTLSLTATVRRPLPGKAPCWRM